MMRVEAARLEGRRALDGVVGTPQLDADLLLAHVLGQTREDLFAHSEAILSGDEEAAYGNCLRLRRQGQPVAYLTGSKEWFGLRLEVSPAVLIPRPETEMLAERAIERARDLDAKSVVDVGTGSGALAIALAMWLPGIDIIATDISPEALTVAWRNIQSHRLSDRIRVLEGDLLQGLTEEPDMVVANLPYLPLGDSPDLSLDVRSEPALSLFGGPQGLDLIARLLREIAERSWESDVLLEVDHRHAAMVVELVQDLYCIAQVDVLPDLAGLDRVLMLRQRDRRTVPGRGAFGSGRSPQADYQAAGKAS